MRPISKLRFDALAGCSRSPWLPLSASEQAWYEDEGERILGVLSIDLHHHDYVSTVLGRDALGQLRAVGLEINIPSQNEAEE